jgi:hypothetical protein
VLEKRANAELAGRKFSRTQLFIAASGEPYPEKYFIKARDIESLAEILRKTNPAGLEWKFERYADESHHSMALRSLHDGLSYFFRGYQPTLRELYVEPEKLKARYQALSARLGERVALREDLLLFFGEQFLTGFNERDQALRYYEMAAEAYPKSEAAKQALGSLRSE